MLSAMNAKLGLGRKRADGAGTLGFSATTTMEGTP